MDKSEIGNKRVADRMSAIEAMEQHNALMTVEPREDAVVREHITPFKITRMLQDTFSGDEHYEIETWMIHRTKRGERKHRSAKYLVQRRHDGEFLKHSVDAHKRETADRIFNMMKTEMFQSKYDVA